MVGKSSVQEIAVLAIIREISDSNLETGRYGPKFGVSSRLSGRVDSTAVSDKTFIKGLLAITGLRTLQKSQ